jgi:pimeloyl-ACP methyl ester carboxylesterase
MSPLIQTSRCRIWYACSHRCETLQSPIILIHGAGGNHLAWPLQMRKLAGCQVLAPDLPGHGRSAGAGCNTISAFGKALIALMDSLNIISAVIGGYSMGGAIALWMALNHAEKIEKLILLATGAKLSVSPEIIQGLVNDREKTLERIISWSFGPTATKDLKELTINSMRETDPDVILSDFIACNEFDVREKLAEIQAPTLVIGGDADKMTPLKYAQYLADHITNSQLVTIKGGGHMMILEQPDTIAGVVLQFIKS